MHKPAEANHLVGSDAGAPRVMADDLTQFLSTAFVGSGMTEPEAAVTAQVLTDADLRGVHTHGAVRVKDYTALVAGGRWRSGRELETVRERGGIALLDGGDGVGPFLAARAMEGAIERAELYGAGWVWVRNAGHFGACAYFSTKATEAEMIGFVFTNSSPAMAPWGGTVPVLGSNPWSIALPRRDGDYPIVLDIANTVTARGRVKAALMRSEEIASGWARDAQGKPTRDPAEALSGSMEPFGGHKGYAISFVVGALTGAIAGSALANEVQPPFGEAVGPQGVGQLFGALDVKAVVAASELYDSLDRLCDLMHSVGSSVVVPGEPEWRKKSEQQSMGIALPHHVWAVIHEHAHAAGIKPPERVK